MTQPRPERSEQELVTQAAVIEGNMLITESRQLRGATTDDEWARRVERHVYPDGWEVVTIHLTYYRVSRYTGRPVETVTTEHRYEVDHVHGEVVLRPLTEEAYLLGVREAES